MQHPEVLAGPPEPGWVHRFPVRVQFDEVDIYGIVHHSRYFVYFERARVDLMGRLGLRPDSLNGERLGLIVVEANVRYRSPARLLDLLEVRQGCRRIGASKTVLVYRLLREDVVVAEAEMTLAFVDGTGRPVRAPKDLRDALSRLGLPGEAARP